MANAWVWPLFMEINGRLIFKSKFLVKRNDPWIFPRVIIALAKWLHGHVPSRKLHERESHVPQWCAKWILKVKQSGNFTWLFPSIVLFTGVCDVRASYIASSADGYASQSYENVGRRTLMKLWRLQFSLLHNFRTLFRFRQIKFSAFFPDLKSLYLTRELHQILIYWNSPRSSASSADYEHCK